MTGFSILRLIAAWFAVSFTLGGLLLGAHLIGHWWRQRSRRRFIDHWENRL